MKNQICTFEIASQFARNDRKRLFCLSSKKVKRGVGAKHSDTNIYAFYQQLTPECYCPYRIEKNNQLTYFTHQQPIRYIRVQYRC